MDLEIRLSYIHIAANLVLILDGIPVDVALLVSRRKHGGSILRHGSPSRNYSLPFYISKYTHSIGNRTRQSMHTGLS